MRQRGGRAYHSILEPHLDFIREQRQRRKTWQEIADLLLTEKGIQVTLYAPYRFYRRHLRRAQRPHWETQAPPAVAQPERSSASTKRQPPRSNPLPPATDFRRPDLSTINTDSFT